LASDFDRLVAESRALAERLHAEATLESDQELWLEAHHRANSAILSPPRLLTREEREYAWDRCRDNDEADERDRSEQRAGYSLAKPWNYR